MRLTCLPTLCGLLLASAVPATAQAYLDDRSTPAALVDSFYNAMNRAEHARALGYFAVPAPEGVEGFASAIGNFERFRVISGQYRETESGQGEPAYELPVAVEMIASDGETSVASGCYTILAAGPTEADGAFLPLRILSGALDPTEAGFEDALPSRCGDGPELPVGDATLDRAQALFETAFADICLPGDATGPESWTVEISLPGRGLEPEIREARLMRFVCSRDGEAHVYLFADEGEIRPVSFVVPELDIRYEDEDSREEVRSVDLIGFTGRHDLLNSEYDPDTLTMTARSSGNGEGGASERGTWIFRSGTFTLVRYEVGAAGAVKTVIDYLAGP